MNLSIETRLRETNNKKNEGDAAQMLFDRYCEYGLLDETARIIQLIPENLQAPIIHTLGAYTTKEKPMTTYACLISRGISEPKTTLIASLIDILWALSVMYDDMFDQDRNRAGVTSAWVEYGSEATFESARAGMQVIGKNLSDAFGDQVAKDFGLLVNESIKSLEEHKKITTEATTRELLENYKKRSRFYTTLPFMALNISNYAEDQQFQALENLSIAGQISNDLKDVLPKYAWVRQPFSDIRSGTMTIPTKILLEKVDERQREYFLKFFGVPQMNREDQLEIELMFKNSGSLDRTITLARRLYKLSLLQFQGSVKKEKNELIKSWIKYKLDQLAEN